MNNKDKISIGEILGKADKKNLAVFLIMMFCLLITIPLYISEILPAASVIILILADMIYLAVSFLITARRSITAEKQNRLLYTAASVYMSVCDLDVINNTASEIRNVNPAIAKAVRSIDHNMQDVFFGIMKGLPESPTKKSAVDFCDLSTIDERMKDNDVATLEYISYGNIWVRSRLIVSERTPDGKISHVIWMLENIDKERKEREALRDISEKAIAASEAKSSFLSNMSHEIRTPINAVLGMNEMILRECSDKNILDYAENIQTAGITLLGIINDILDFSKIEAGKMDIIPVEYELSSVINDLVAMIRSRAEDKGLLIELNCDPMIPALLRGDEIRIKQIITNILTNAVKYTEKGTVTFSVGYKPDKSAADSIMLCISVKDTGIGIKKEDISKLFTLFERIDENRNRGIEGTGLGMNITQRLLAMMGSSLNVESEYGKGSVFSFEIRQDVIQWDPVGDIESSFKKAHETSKSYKAAFSAPNARVLVVDDTKMNLTVFKSLLKKTDIQIDTAESGDECIAAALRQKYDIIYLDHMMPHKNGVETLHELNELSENPNKGTPVICLTANAVSGAREMYLAAGFDDYLTKPIDPTMLEEMTKKYLPPEKLRSPSESRSSQSGETDTLPDFLYEINEIDISTGLNNCGSSDIYTETLKTFTEMIAPNISEVRSYFESGDTENAVIKIHALKSTLRIIGARDTGALAEKLELAGKAGDIKTVADNIDELLDRCRILGEKLKPILSVSEENSDDLPEISSEALFDAYSALKCSAESFDYDNVVLISDELKKYRVPAEEAERYAALRKAADNYDYDLIPDILSDI